MGKHNASADLQAKADEFDLLYAESVAGAAENEMTADQRIAALKQSQSEYRRLHGRQR